MTPELLERYDQRIPRYTSYPTAPHFTADVDDARYREWLGGMAPETDASVYLHIPFCRELCWYCGCNMRVVRRPGPVRTYTDSLITEIDRVADALPGKLNVSHIHFGGGSPNSLAPEDLERIIARLRKNFAVAPDAEIAVEIDPRTTTGTFVEACGGAGVTRASLGVQELDEAVQQAVNRVQSYDLIKRLVARLRGVGVDDINMDLMYGLPQQTVSHVTDTIDRVVSLAPSRIALFGYAHVPWMKKHMRLIDETQLPDGNDRWAQFEAATERLLGHGYVGIGMDHFAHPGSSMAQALASGALHRNFQGYTTDTSTALLGFGASAIGSLPDGYVQNDPDIRRWQAAISEGGLATVRGCRLSDDDRLRRRIIERLMCDMAVDVADVIRECGGDASEFAPAFDILEPMVRDGLVETTGMAVRMTPRGKPLVRAAAAAFDRYLHAGDAESPRHSNAI